MYPRSNIKVADVDLILQSELTSLERILAADTKAKSQDIQRILHRIASLKKIGVGSNQWSHYAYNKHFSRITALILLAYMRNEERSLYFVKNMLLYWQPLTNRIPPNTRNKAFEDNYDAFIAFGKTIEDVGNGRIQYEMMSMILRYLLGIQLLEEQIIRQFFNWLPDIAAVVHGIADRPLFTKTKILLAAINNAKRNVITYQPYALFLGKKRLRGTEHSDLWIDFNTATNDFTVFLHSELLGLCKRDDAMVYATIASNRIISHKITYFRQRSEMHTTLDLNQYPTNCSPDMAKFMKKNITIVFPTQKGHREQMKRIFDLLRKWLKLPELGIILDDSNMPNSSEESDGTSEEPMIEENTEISLPETEHSLPVGQCLVEKPFDRDSEDMTATGTESSNATVVLAIDLLPEIVEMATDDLPSREKQRESVHSMDVSNSNETNFGARQNVVYKSPAAAGAASEQAGNAEDQSRPSMPKPDPYDELPHVKLPDWHSFDVNRDINKNTCSEMTIVTIGPDPIRANYDNNVGGQFDEEVTDDDCVLVSHQTYSDTKTTGLTENNVNIHNNLITAQDNREETLNAAFVHLLNTSNECLKSMNELSNRLYDFGVSAKYIPK